MFESSKVVLFDLDGTLYYGSNVIEGAAQAVQDVRDRGKRVYFVSNNSAKTRGQLFEKLSNMGIACKLDEILSSGYVTGLYIKREKLEDVYICASRNLIDELGGQGIHSVSPEHARNLIVGFDPDFTYQKMTEGVRVALHAERVIGCNDERVYRSEGAQWFPGCGGMLASIEWCANRKADYLVGKPNTLMPELIAEKYGYGKDEILVVGDGRETDVRMAKNFGCPCVLVGGAEDPAATCIPSVRGLAGLLG